MRYRIDAERGTRFVAREHPNETAAITLFFQRRGDNWSARGRYEDYRWYAPISTMVPLRPGEHQITLRLDDPLWGSVMGASAAQRPGAFAATLAQTERVGFVLGSISGRGHGVFATAPARFTLLDFEVR